MKEFLRSGFLMIALCGALGLVAHAQAVLYSTDFADDQGWTFTANSPEFRWNVDATPPSVIGSPSWLSAPHSLNYNNGVACGTGFKTYGHATSPPIDLSVANGALSLGFWCNFDVEHNHNCFGYDRRWAYVLNGSGQVAQYCFQNICEPEGQWHFHSVPLDASWGVVQVQFYFDTVDGFENNGAGWFIDDLEVNEECPSWGNYCQPKANSQFCAPSIFATGTPSLSGAGQAFRIWAENVLNQKVGLMLWGRAPASVPFAGGTLCVAPPLTRTAAQNSGGSSLPTEDCTGAYVFQFTPAMMSQGGLIVGDNVYSQYWSRDNGFPPPNNVGLTGAVHWEVCP